MSSPPPSDALRTRLDPAALARTCRRMGAESAPPWLHQEVARRLGERLGVMRDVPGVYIDWSAGWGGSEGVLRAAYPKSRAIAVQPGPVSAAQVAAGPGASRRWWAWPRSGGPAPRLHESEVRAGTAQMVWSNMALHFAPDLRTTLQAWQRALAAGGFVMFSTLGPGSFPLLRAVYRAQGWGPSHSPFVDMHDLGDLLLEAGFADPVMDQETLTLTYADADALLAELRTLGANLDPGRHTGLRTSGWRSRLLQALTERGRTGDDGRLALDVEIVYGHAWRVERGPAVAADTRVALDDMRRMLQRPRRGP